jgi:lipoprotein-releasing system permease protein
MPRFKTFTVAGVFRIGRAFGFETNLAYINMQDAQTLFQFGSDVSGLRLKVKDLYEAPRIGEAIAQHLTPDYQVSNWTSDYGSIMHSIALEKTMMFLILLLLVAISAFNLVSSLMMVVTDKRSDIAILRTLGATPKTILSIFIVQGSVIGIFGTLLGLVGGILLATHVSEILHFIEHTFHVQLLSSNVYFFVNTLPSQLQSEDIIKITSAALGMSFIATIYPAWRAARTEPAEALRYE